MRKNLSLIPVLCISGALLGGCVRPVTTIRMICPEPPHYSTDSQKALAAEIIRYGDQVPVLVSREIDWNRFQMQLNACNGYRPSTGTGASLQSGTGGENH